MDFLEMTDPNQGTVVFDIWVPRARLGLHLRLSQIYEKIAASPTAQAIADYLALAGLERECQTGLQQIQAFLALAELNRLKALFAYQKFEHPPGKDPPYTYPGRVWALYIHKLASRYGWTRDDIFELWPEEVSAYIQEILVAEYDEADERRALTNLAYKYDEATKQSRFIPVPRPGWMMDEKKEKLFRIRRDMLPVGNIINLSNKTDDDFNIH